VSESFEERSWLRGGCSSWLSRLTGGGGLSGIDVADNDHVNVHLLLTAMASMVSRCPIKIAAIALAMLRMASQMRTAFADGESEGRRNSGLTHPMMAV